MNIIITDIPDINKNVDEAKATLGQKIIEGISPLLDEFHVGKINELDNLTKKYKMVKSNVIKKKTRLEELLKLLDKKKKVKQLLEKISRLVSAGFGYDSSFKNEVVVLLKVIENLPEKKLDFHIKDMANQISKRFLKNT